MVHLRPAGRLRPMVHMWPMVGLGGKMLGPAGRHGMMSRDVVCTGVSRGARHWAMVPMMAAMVARALSKGERASEDCDNEGQGFVHMRL